MGTKSDYFCPFSAYFGVFSPDLLMEYRIFISIVDISTNLKNGDIDKGILENIIINKAIPKNIDIDKEILENNDIHKEILENINIDEILNRLEFGISNRVTCVSHESVSCTQAVEKRPCLYHISITKCTHVPRCPRFSDDDNDATDAQNIHGWPPFTQSTTIYAICCPTRYPDFSHYPTQIKKAPATACCFYIDFSLELSENACQSVLYLYTHFCSCARSFIYPSA